MNARRQAMELLQAGDRDGAALFVEERNAAFAGRGIKPIVIPGL